MLIGISGTMKSGKREVQTYLSTFHGFESLDVGDRPHYNELFDYATEHWNTNMTIIINNESQLQLFSKRPYFLHVSVDAPMMVRWRRYNLQTPRREGQHGELTLAMFVSVSDPEVLTDNAPLYAKAKLRIFNPSNSLTTLHAHLVALRLTETSRLRPTWDLYFMQLASLAAQRSNCMKRRVGCVLVHEKRVVSTGYNGTPRGVKNCNEGGCERCNNGLSSGVSLNTCLCMHAEENALLEAGRSRIGDGAVLYCDTCPCLTCTIKIVQMGIREVVYSASYSMDGASAQVCWEAGVRLRQYSPPPDGLMP